jgi:hypothetical protein
MRNQNDPFHLAERLLASYRLGETRKFMDVNMLAVGWVLVARRGLKGKRNNGFSKQDEQANPVRAGLPRE